MQTDQAAAMSPTIQSIQNTLLCLHTSSAAIFLWLCQSLLCYNTMDKSLLSHKIHVSLFYYYKDEFNTKEKVSSADISVV